MFKALLQYLPLGPLIGAVVLFALLPFDKAQAPQPALRHPVTNQSGV